MSIVLKRSVPLHEVGDENFEFHLDVELKNTMTKLNNLTLIVSSCSTSMATTVNKMIQLLPTMALVQQYACSQIALAPPL